MAFQSDAIWEYFYIGYELKTLCDEILKYI